MQKLAQLFFLLTVSASFAQTGVPAEADCPNLIQKLKPLTEKRLGTADGARAAEQLAACYELANDTASLDNLTARFLEFYAATPERAKVEVIAAKRNIKSDSTLFKGIDILLNVVSYTKDSAVRKEAVSILERTISQDSRLTVSDLASIADKATVSHRLANTTWMRLGKDLSGKQNYRAARYWYKKVITANADGEKVKFAKEALENLEGKPSVPTLLVLAPISGDFAEFGIEAVNGVKLALERSGLSGKINLRIADTKADAVEALRRTRQVVAQDSIIAIIGPIMSAPAATVGAWLSSTHTRIPMLTPTATDAGISRMGSNIFQVNVSMDNLATGIANYAVDCLGIREFAILSPIGNFGTAMAQSFEKAVRNRGGIILATQEFEEGRPDYTTEFRKLRTERFNQLLHKKNIARGAKDLDAISAKDKRSFMQDSVFNIPGIFIPSSSPSDAGLIARQVAFHKLSGTLLGTSGWYGQDLIDEGKKLVEKSYFSIPFATDSTSNAYEEFRSAYKSRWNEEPKPDRVSGLSYSAANIVLSLFAAGEIDIVKKLYSTKTFQGVYGNIRFEKGANASIQIMSVESGEFVNRSDCPAK